jgi:hypothetical protein
LVVVFIFQREQYAMRQACFRWLCLLAILFAGPASGAQRIKNIEVAVADPSSTVRSAADIVIPIAEIRKVAPDFTPGALIVTVTDRSTLEEEAAVLQTEELPSQVDDLDGDGQADEPAFQVDMAAHQSRIFTISYGDRNRIGRLRSDYQQRTAALFSRAGRLALAPTTYASCAFSAEMPLSNDKPVRDPQDE